VQLKGIRRATASRPSADSGIFEYKYSYYCAMYFEGMVSKQQFRHVFGICTSESKEIEENGGICAVTKSALLSLNHV